MRIEPWAFCHEQLPALYEVAVQALEAAAGGGDAGAQRLLDEAREQPMAVALTLEGQGGGRAYLVSDGRSLVVSPDWPEAPVFYALAMPVATAAQAADEVQRRAAGGREPPVRVGRALAVLASRRARELFGTTPYAFELRVSRVPVVATLSARVALGRADHPPAPEFSLSVDFDELQDARELGIAPHQLFMSGKIQVAGDAAKAMMLGMSLAQLR